MLFIKAYYQFASMFLGTKYYYNYDQHNYIFTTLVTHFVHTIYFTYYCCCLLTCRKQFMSPVRLCKCLSITMITC